MPLGPLLPSCRRLERCAASTAPLARLQGLSPSGSPSRPRREVPAGASLLPWVSTSPGVSSRPRWPAASRWPPLPSLGCEPAPQSFVHGRAGSSPPRPPPLLRSVHLVSLPASSQPMWPWLMVSPRRSGGIAAPRTPFRAVTAAPLKARGIDCRCRGRFVRPASRGYPHPERAARPFALLQGRLGQDFHRRWKCLGDKLFHSLPRWITGSSAVEKPALPARVLEEPVVPSQRGGRARDAEGDAGRDLSIQSRSEARSASAERSPLLRSTCAAIGSPRKRRTTLLKPLDEESM